MNTNYYNLDVEEFHKILKSENKNEQLHVTSYSTKEGNYKIVRYNKEFLDVDDSFGLFRSVVVNEQNKVISFAPPKSFSIERFTDLNPTKTNNIVAEEFVEGTMMNVFWDEQCSAWNFATRNVVGANVSFYKTEKNKTFNTMFNEALNESNLKLDDLNKSYCYSFVLQHPENRIVIPCVIPVLYLVQVCEIVDLKVFVHSMESVKLEETWKNTRVRFPHVYGNWNTYDDLQQAFGSLNTPYNIMGVVIKNTESNDRCKIRNPVYENIRQLKGNQPKLQYQYLSLRKTGKIAEYLKFYPECKQKFTKYRNELHMFTNTLFMNYISCYIKKERPLGEFPGQYKTHMYKIHQIFLNELKPNSQFVTNTVVIKYVNDLHESQQMNALHYNLKQQVVDTEKSVFDMKKISETNHEENR